MDLEDRRPTYVDLQLNIKWRLEGLREPSIATKLPMPELVVQFGEPRVLALLNKEASMQDILHLDFIIENPSIYSLNFSVTMDTSDEFAFSGGKSSMLHLTPLSRQSIQYKLLPLVKGTWISPQLRVYDVQFHKTLRVLGTEGVRNDRKGIGVWVDVDE